MHRRSNVVGVSPRFLAGRYDLDHVAGQRLLVHREPVHDREGPRRHDLRRRRVARCSARFLRRPRHGWRCDSAGSHPPRPPSVPGTTGDWRDLAPRSVRSRPAARMRRTDRSTRPTGCRRPVRWFRPCPYVLRPGTEVRVEAVDLGRPALHPAKPGRHHFRVGDLRKAAARNRPPTAAACSGPGPAPGPPPSRDCSAPPSPPGKVSPKRISGWRNSRPRTIP